MTISNMTKDWNWISCSLCDKEIILIKEKIKNENDVLCVNCLMVELKIEAETIRMEMENDKVYL